MPSRTKRIGRPLKEPSSGQRVSLGLKVTAEVKRRLDKAARESGRTQSQEAELRLERSFEKEDLLPEVLALRYGREVAGILMLIGRAARDTGGQAAFASTLTLEGAQRWYDNPFAYDQAVKAMGHILDVLRPSGKVTPHSLKTLGPTGPAWEQTYKNLGRAFAEAILSGVVGRGVTESNQWEDEQIARLLGTLQKRIVRET